MEFRVLGPLEASERGRRVPLGGRRQRAILAHLLLRANEVVSTDRLIDDVWGDGAPEAARNALQSYISRLRHTLGDGGRIEGRPPGYVLHASREEIDLLRFETLLTEGRRALGQDPEEASRKLEEALELWRGPALADLANELSLRAEIGRLEDLRLAALEERVAADLAVGRHANVVGELEGLTAEHPLRERLWGQLMLSLYRSGRQADALAAYRRARSLLADELGLEPSPELQRLEGQILRHDPVLDPGEKVLRGYRLGAQIGQGSFGAVFRATQLHLGREVAVKVIHSRLANDPRFIRRFDAEAQLVARLEHPHIVPLYDYWREPGAAYLVMRWFRGGNLRERLARGPLGFERAARTVEQVAAGLAVAHRQGVVHRDLKPANILLDEEGNAYLSDFGIATDALSGTAESSDPESSAYLSPEQLRGEPTTTRTDVYSLGVMLRQSLAPAESNGALDEVVRRATAEDPGARYGDADELAVALRDALGRAGTEEAVRLRNPFKGLRPFLEADADDFFGREALTERLVARLESGASTRFVLLVGASGSGKSSAVRAGLVPALRGGAGPGSQSWFVVQMSPGAHPLEELEAALVRIAAEPAEGLAEELAADEHGLLRAVQRILPPGAEVLLVVDQLEEVFTLVEDEERRAHFLRSLVVAATEPASPFRIVATLRGDFYDRPLRYRGLAELVRAGTEALVPMSDDGVRRAVAQPAERVGLALEPGLCERIVADVTDQPGSLPLLQYTLTELFERRRENTLTLDAYRAVGGIPGALVRRAEELHAALDEDAQAAARQLFLRLVTLGEGVEDTRRRVPRGELASVEQLGVGMEAVMDVFGRFRLLSFDRDPQTREPTVEVAHEALLREWGRLRGWIDGAREDVRMHRRLAAAAAEWTAAGRDPSFLLRGSRLEQLEGWASSSQLALAASEKDYLAVSAASRDEERATEETRRAREAALERRSLTRLRVLVAVLGLAALVALGLTLFAFGQRGEAREEAARAEREARIATARELAAAATAAVEDDPELALLLGLEAVDATRAADGTVLREAEEALRGAVHASRVVRSVPGVSAAALAPDGSRVATARRDGSVTVWSTASGEELLVLPGDGIRGVAFGADGKRILTFGEDGTVRVWDAGTGVEARSFAADGGAGLSPDARLLAVKSGATTAVHEVETGRVLASLRVGGEPLALSSDGALLALGGDGVRVVTVPGGREVLRADGDAYDAAFSPDGSLFAAVGIDVADVWRLETGERAFVVGEMHPITTSVDFSRDGSRIATASHDGAARVWEAETGRELLRLAGRGAEIDSVAFSADGRRLAAAGKSGRATVWDLTPQGRRELLTIPATSEEPVYFSVAFSHDGRLLAGASGDPATAQVWDAGTGRPVATLPGHRAPVTDASFTRDGKRLVTTSFDGSAKLWDLSTGTEIRSFAGHSAPVWGVALSPDGSRLATVSEDHSARVWEAETGGTRLVLRHPDQVYDVDYSPDGSLLATSGLAGAWIWDAATGDERARLVGHDGNVVQIAFTPDGERVVTAGFDATARVWNAVTGKQLRELSGHTGIVIDVEASPDGSRIATASFDGTTRLWDARTGAELLVLSEESAPGRLAFSPEGRRLAVAAGKGTVRVYALQIEQLVALARQRLSRDLTDAECRQYLHRTVC